MQHASGSENQPSSQHLEMSLREHLLAAGASGSGPHPYPATSGPPPAADLPYPSADTGSPHEHYDPNSSGQPPFGIGVENHGGDENSATDPRKGKRELSTSKRAAQNRAAQRAFRQRKEGYIKKLEEQVRDFETMEESYRALQHENYQLREYILNLQSLLLKNHSDFPPAPTQTNPPAVATERADRSAVDQQLRREMDLPHNSNPLRHDAMSQLQAAAAQASDTRPADGGQFPINAEQNNRRARADDAGTDLKATS